MLSQTKENLQDIVGKLQLLDFTIDTIGRTHSEYKEKAETVLKTISAHKMKLIDEIMHLSGVTKA